VIATARRAAALSPGHLWAEATKIRDEWLDLGLSTAPADRSATEEAIASIYAGHRRGRPEFVWVLSPAAAGPHLAGLPTHQTLRSCLDDRHPPVASDIAAGLSRLRSELAATYVEPPPDRKPMQRPKGKPWPALPAERALDAGLPFHELLRQGVREALSRTLADAIHNPIRAAIPGFPSRDTVPVCWYGHQDSAWIGHADVLHRLGLATPAGAFHTWATLARSGGWWWPGEQLCVLVDRPAVIRTEPVPGAWHGERRLRSVEYRDGWSV
jgi:hypothetical protein